MIKRDGLMLALYTGLRHDDVRTMRFDEVDLDDETVHLPNPKGGPGAAFTVPLSKTPLAITCSPYSARDSPRCTYSTISRPMCQGYPRASG
ncbi:MAG TPA: hypothetical protein VHN14_36785 [Kofleriaceae bacterium]|nr:hypothetical protein [Kofleriaceae bacterium]